MDRSHRRTWPALAALALAAWLALPAAALGGAKVEAAYGASVRGSIEGYRLLVLRGTHGQRGEAHGYLCAKELVRAGDACVAQAMARGKDAYEGRILPLVRQMAWPARYEEELEGVLRGIRKALPDAKDRMIPSLGREISLDDLKAGNSLADWAYFGCSSFSAWGARTADGGVVIGRNLDWPATPDLLALQTVMVFVPEEEGLKPTVGFSFVGFLGVTTAMNADAVLVALHDARGLAAEPAPGRVPRCLALREAVEKATAENAAEDVARELRRAPPLVGNLIHVVWQPALGRRGPPAAVLEWDAHEKDGGVTVRGPDAAEMKDALFCTNHYLSRADQRGSSGDSPARYDRMKAAVEKLAADGEAFGALASVRRVIEAGATRLTIQSMMVWPGTKSFAVALAAEPGRPAVGARWIQFAWEDVFAAKPEAPDAAPKP